MPNRVAERRVYLDADPEQPLIAVPWWDGEVRRVRYFVDQAEADAFAAEQRGHRAMSVFGAWSDLDADEVEEALEQIRRESRPTPPLDDLDEL